MIVARSVRDSTSSRNLSQVADWPARRHLLFSRTYNRVKVSKCPIVTWLVQRFKTSRLCSLLDSLLVLSQRSLTTMTQGEMVHSPRRSIPARNNAVVLETYTLHSATSYTSKTKGTPSFINNSSQAKDRETPSHTAARRPGKSVPRLVHDHASQCFVRHVVGSMSIVVWCDGWAISPA